ncbi:unnamed protein product [Didymodactylos carnosus]|uniref:Uncharacterized protein n=1 Tax=Didymodactylos carnosus TaxID=1234261 RepID=A0A815RYD5_9BILA|nr:unnamed protein product [Didymodactylos carnosus]CAF4348651.1 unnamed protein product [Didymodactylos carnosus]
MYYQEQIPKIFGEQCKIPNKNGLYDMAIEKIMQNGWLSGIELIQKKLTPKTYNSLIESKLKLLIPIQSSATSEFPSTITTGENIFLLLQEKTALLEIFVPTKKQLRTKSS